MWTSLGAIAVPLAAQRLILLLGWRATYAVFGGTTLLLPLSVFAAFLAEYPRRKRTGSEGILPLQSIRPEHYEGLRWHDTSHQPIFFGYSFVLSFSRARACSRVFFTCRNF